MQHLKKPIALLLLALMLVSMLSAGAATAIAARAADETTTAAAAENEPAEDPKPETPAAAVSITADSVEVVVKKTIGMHAETSGFAAAPTLSWKSSDTGVATVDANGTVKGISVGRATITVTAKSGETEAGDLA